MTSAPIDGPTKVLAGIGHICLQWSLLEFQALYILSAIEGDRQPTTFLKYGGLDMIPRLNMCINLAQHSKVPVPLVQRIRAIRKSLQGEGGLAEKRNQAVHGVHKNAADPDSVTLTMTRWHEPKRTQTVTSLDLLSVAHELHILMHEANSIGEAIWERRLKILKDKADQDRRKLSEASTPISFKVAKRLKDRINSFGRKR